MLHIFDPDIETTHLTPEGVLWPVTVRVQLDLFPEHLKPYEALMIHAGHTLPYVIATSWNNDQKRPMLKVLGVEGYWLPWALVSPDIVISAN